MARNKRQDNKDTVIKAINSIDNAQGYIIRLMNVLNVTNLETPELYQEFLNGNDNINYGNYSNYIKPLMLAYYYLEQAEEPMSIVRKTI